MVSENDLSHEADALQQPPIMKKKGNPSRILIAFFIFNLILTGFIFLALTSIFILVLPLYSPYFLALAVINSIIIFYIIKKQPHGPVKDMSYLALIFPTFYLFVGLATLPTYMKTTPILISREEAFKQINDCNVRELTRYSNEKASARVVFIEGKYATDDLPKRPYVVADSDFDALLDAARAVKDRCDYDFEGFVSEVEGLKKADRGIYITIDQTVQLLNKCTIKQVNLSPEGPLYSWDKPTGAPTGIILWSKKKPETLFVEEDLKAATLPIFFEAKKKCPNLEIY